MQIDNSISTLYLFAIESYWSIRFNSKDMNFNKRIKQNKKKMIELFTTRILNLKVIKKSNCITLLSSYK